jgi:acyl-CoA synthetase (AMP-forming)/AMP-acid ligase II
VAEVAVVAAPDPRLGEHAAAVLRLLPGHAVPALAQIRDHLARAGLARQKWPEEIHAVDDFPPWDTIPQMVLSTADRFGEAEAIVDGDLRLTFTGLVDRVRRAAGAFAEAGIEKGDRVAIWAPNSAEWIIAAFGLLTAGAVLVPVNTRFKAAEAGDIIGRSGAKITLVQQNFLDLDFSAPAGVPVVDLKSGFLESGSPFERKVSGEDVPTSSSPRARPGGPRAS